MSTQTQIDFQRISDAIQYIQAHFREQPDLNQIASSVYLSPAHFQRMFTAWAGVSPKKFLQFISLEHAKSILLRDDASIAKAAYDTGFSSTSRLHELFIHIESMTPAEYKNGGVALQIRYDFFSSPFGMVIIAATDKGICHIAFDENAENALHQLQQRFPLADFHKETQDIQTRAQSILNNSVLNEKPLFLHLQSTPFQLKVWESLLRIPVGQLTTYKSIATHIGNPNASRAVGTAIGQNPIAYLIPCHRVIQSSGAIGGYMWGTARKTAMIAWESAQNYSKQIVL